MGNYYFARPYLSGKYQYDDQLRQRKKSGCLDHPIAVTATGCPGVVGLHLHKKTFALMIPFTRMV